MKRSESAAYITYSTSRVSERYRKALSAYLDFISDSHGEFDTSERAEAVQRLGELYFYLGDTEVAKFFYKISSDCQPNSLRIKMGYARFLSRQLMDQNLAIALCDEITDIVDKTSSDGGRESERQKQFALELKEEIVHILSKEC